MELLAAAGAVLVACLLIVRDRGSRARVTRGGAQELRVRVKGGYVPERIVVRAGVPVRLVFHREETAPCSESVVFPDFGTSVMLPPHRDVAVELPASEPGEHEFTCHMGMLRGRVIVIAADTWRAPARWSRRFTRSADGLHSFFKFPSDLPEHSTRHLEQGDRTGMPDSKINDDPRDARGGERLWKEQP